VQEEKRRNMITFCVLLLCAFRLIMFMRMHPHLGTITSTFGTVGVQLLNFLCSFGTIFIFMAVTAHVQYAPPFTLELNSLILLIWIKR
jgi:hypothetical protein